MKVKKFDFKFKGMRKPDSFIVYPRAEGDTEIKVQGSRTIARFDIITGKGWLNFKGSNSKYSVHLLPFMGGKYIQFPVEFTTKACEFMPSSGDTLGASSVKIV